MERKTEESAWCLYFRLPIYAFFFSILWARQSWHLMPCYLGQWIIQTSLTNFIHSMYQIAFENGLSWQNLHYLQWPKSSQSFYAQICGAKMVFMNFSHWNLLKYWFLSISKSDKLWFLPTLRSQNLNFCQIFGFREGLFTFGALYVYLSEKEA